jgi:transposase InsO family protein
VRRRATRKDEVWGMDFVSDRTTDRCPLRMLAVLDECTRECLAIEVGRHCRDKDVVRVLDELTAIRGAPATLPSDNGPEFGSAAMRKWCEGAVLARSLSTRAQPDRTGSWRASTAD